MRPHRRVSWGEGAAEVTGSFRIVICGAGNEAHVMAAYTANLQNTEVCLLKIVHEHDSVGTSQRHTITARHRDSREDVVGRGITVSNCAHDAVSGANLVILPVPTNAMEQYMKAIAEYLSPGTIVGILAQTGSVEWAARALFGSERYDSLCVFYMLDMPWACRVSEPGVSVSVLGTKAMIDVSVEPSALTDRVFELLTELFGTYAAVEDETTSKLEVIPRLNRVNGLLPLSLTVSAVIHTGIIYGQFQSWDGTSSFDQAPLFYHGVDEQTAQLLEGMSCEGMAIVRELSARYPFSIDAARDCVSLLDWIKRAYPHDIEDPSSLYSCLRTNRAYAGLTHPMVELAPGKYIPDVSSRYWTEDLSCHLLLAKGVAELLGGLSTPLMDKVLLWMQARMGLRYMAEGKLIGANILNTSAPQRYNLSLDDIMLKSRR